MCFFSLYFVFASFFSLIYIFFVVLCCHSLGVESFALVFVVVAVVLTLSLRQVSNAAEWPTPLLPVSVLPRTTKAPLPPHLLRFICVGGKVSRRLVSPPVYCQPASQPAGPAPFLFGAALLCYVFCLFCIICRPGSSPAVALASSCHNLLIKYTHTHIYIQIFCNACCCCYCCCCCAYLMKLFIFLLLCVCLSVFGSKMFSYCPTPQNSLDATAPRTHFTLSATPTLHRFRRVHNGCLLLAFLFATFFVCVCVRVRVCVCFLSWPSPG